VKRIGHSLKMWGILIFFCSSCSTTHQHDKAEVYFPKETVCHPYRIPLECVDGQCARNARLEVDCELSRRD